MLPNIMAPGLVQGQKVGPHIEPQLPGSEDILKDQAALRQVFGLEELAPEHVALLEAYAKFCDNHIAPVAATLLGSEPIHIDGENRYPPETARLFEEYAARGFIGIAADSNYGNDPEHKGLNLPKTLLPAVAMLGFNASPSFYLKEMVTQGVLNLLQTAIDYEAAHGNDQEKIAMLQNILSKLIKGEYTGAMVLTEPATGGANIGRNMQTFATVPDGSDRVHVEGPKKYITGFTKGGIASVQNAIAIVISATKDGGGKILKTTSGKTAVTASLVPLFRLDEKGNTIQTTQRNNIRTSHWIKKPGFQQQILEMHVFEGSEGRLLGERGKGWEMMFEVMNPARMEIGAQGVSGIYTMYGLVANYVTKRGLDTSSSVAFAEAYPSIVEKLNVMRAFAMTASAVLMNAGFNMDIASGHKESWLDGRGNKVEAEALTALEMPMIKAHFTNCAVKLANEMVSLMGADGYISPVVTQVLEDLRPTRFYEGPNEMMAKQIVFQKFFTDGKKPKPRMNFFIKETEIMLKGWAWERDATPDMRKMVKAMRSSLNLLKERTKYLRDEHIKMSEGDRDAERRMQIASEDYLALYGSVCMGREALRIAACAEHKLAGDLTAAEREDWEHRLMMADLALLEFVEGPTAALKARRQKSTWHATMGPNIKAKVKAAHQSMSAGPHVH